MTFNTTNKGPPLTALGYFLMQRKQSILAVNDLERYSEDAQNKALQQAFNNLRETETDFYKKCVADKLPSIPELVCFFEGQTGAAYIILA